MQFFPGDMDAYFRYVREENDRERRDRERRARAEIDPSLQCEHRVSLYRTCTACG